MRFSTAALALAATAAVATGAAAAGDERCPSTTYGGAGAPTFKRYTAPIDHPGYNDGREPTIGIPWHGPGKDKVFYWAVTYQYRVTFDEDDNALWEDKTPVNSITNVDPMMHVDQITGRVFGGGLAGPCSVMAFSDDAGENWYPTGNMCSGANFDHQTLGTGPPAKIAGINAVPFGRATYYCAQLGTTSCATSFDGGVTWGPFIPGFGGCGAQHGHIAVSPITGTAIVPHRGCQDMIIGSWYFHAIVLQGTFDTKVGFLFSDNNGLAWDSRLVDDSAPSETYGKDPAAHFTEDSGWLYIGAAHETGASVALSKDEGLSWELIGAGMGVEPQKWLNIGQFHEPAIVAATFADLKAGDDDRVAFSFIGLLDQDGDGTPNEYPNTEQCETGQELMFWYYFTAFSYDAGNTWSVVQMSDNIVQLGGVANAPCRNLLDFQDMEIDTTGRVHIGYGDGCSGDCEEFPTPGAAGYRSSVSTIFRQTGGRGLFAVHDDQLSPAPENCTEPLVTVGPASFPQVLAEREARRSVITYNAEAESCFKSCGTALDSAAESGCLCGPSCAEDDSQCCGDWSAHCSAGDATHWNEAQDAIEVTMYMDQGPMLDFRHHSPKFFKYLGKHFAASEDNVKLYDWQYNKGLATFVVFPRTAAATVLNDIFDSDTFAANMPDETHAYVMYSMSTKIVSFGDASFDATTANVNAAAAACASDSSVASGTAAAVAVATGVAALAVGAAAGALISKRRANKAGLSSQDSLA